LEAREQKILGQKAVSAQVLGKLEAVSNLRRFDDADKNDTVDTS